MGAGSKWNSVQKKNKRKFATSEYELNRARKKEAKLQKRKKKN